MKKDKRMITRKTMKLFVIIAVFFIMFLFSNRTVHAAAYEQTNDINFLFDLSNDSLNFMQMKRYESLIEIESERESLIQEMTDIMSIIYETEINEVPYINQLDYNVSYGQYGTVASQGCGITSIAMVVSYMLNEMTYPDELAKEFGAYNTEKGSCWTLFEDSAKSLGVPFQEQTYDWNHVETALKNGQLVICSQGPGLFTNCGHFIVLIGMTEDEKIIVRDPNGNNYKKNQILQEGFQNGFSKDEIITSAKTYFIYGDKKMMQEEMNLKELMKKMDELLLRKAELFSSN